MKIGIIGLGSIALKAYLPSISQMKQIDIHLCTRNEQVLQETMDRFHINNGHTSIEKLAEQNITAAFVHSSTDSHEKIIDYLLDQNIHVYVDKPLTNNAEATNRLIDKANSRGLLLMVGFNRRYAKVYKSLKEVKEPTMILMQKNRVNELSTIREFVLDDFIHVIDTVLFLFPYEIEHVHVSGKVEENLLHHATLQIEGEGSTAIALMNRVNGASEERAETAGPAEKRIAENVRELFILRGKKMEKQAEDDWEPTLTKRGFTPMVEDFLSAVRQGRLPAENANNEVRRVHELAEEVITRLEKGLK